MVTVRCGKALPTCGDAQLGQLVQQAGRAQQQRVGAEAQVQPDQALLARLQHPRRRHLAPPIPFQQAAGGPCSRETGCWASAAQQHCTSLWRANDEHEEQCEGRDMQAAARTTRRLPAARTASQAARRPWTSKKSRTTSSSQGSAHAAST